MNNWKQQEGIVLKESQAVTRSVRCFLLEGISPPFSLPYGVSFNRVDVTRHWTSLD